MTAILLVILCLPSLALHLVTYRIAIGNPTRPAKPGRCQHCGYNRSGLGRSARCPECGQRQNHTNARRENARKSTIWLLSTPGLLTAIAVLPALYWTVSKEDDTAMLVWLPTGLAVGSTLVALNLLRWLQPRDVFAIKRIPWLTFAALMLASGLMPIVLPGTDGMKVWMLQVALAWIALPASAIAGLIVLAPN